VLGEPLEQPVSLGTQNIRTIATHRPGCGASVARNRFDHFTTLATLTLKVAATDRQLSPATTAATTRSRKSRE
jgi:hypothetical protein